MNIRLATAFGAVALAATTSFAQASEYVDFSNVVSTRTRAEVVSELAAARADGTTLLVLDGVYPVISRPAGPPRERREVRAELAQFRTAYPNLNAELDYPLALQPAPAQQRVATATMPSAAR
jgi:hypothetical protein